MPMHAAPAGWIRGFVTFYIPLALTASAVSYVAAFAPGFRFRIEKVSSTVVVPGTGAGATRLLRVLKGASTVAASATHTLAGTATAGTKLDFTLSTTDSDLLWGDADTITVDYPASGTLFTAGTVNLIVQFLQRPQQR